MLIKRVDIFGTGIILCGRSDVSQIVAGPCRLQLCAVLGELMIKLADTSVDLYQARSYR